MIKALQCNTFNCTITDIHNPKKISDLLVEPNQIIWLDLQDPTMEELTILGDEFGLHPLALEDASTEHQRPKMEQYDTFTFLVFYALSIDADEQNIHTRELSIFIGKNYVITVHHQTMPELDEAERRWRRNGIQSIERSSGFLLYVILDTIVDGYFPIVDQQTDKAEDLEDQIYIGSSHKITFELLELKKQFMQVRRVVVAERDVLNTLTNRDNPLIHEKTLIYFRDIYDHITRLADTIDIVRDQLSSLMDANLSVTSNNLNRVMKTLTATSIVLMSASLIAGIYGMNFVNMPELHWHYGYPLALGAMVLVALAVILIFKKFKWF